MIPLPSFIRRRAAGRRVGDHPQVSRPRFGRRPIIATTDPLVGPSVPHLGLGPPR